MNADSAPDLPGTSMREKVRRGAEGVILFDPGVSPQVDSDWFDPDHWRRHGVLQAQKGGRGGLHSWLRYAAEAYAKGAEASPLSD